MTRKHAAWLFWIFLLGAAPQDPSSADQPPAPADPPAKADPGADAPARANPSQDEPPKPAGKAAAEEPPPSPRPGDPAPDPFQPDATLRRALGEPTPSGTAFLPLDSEPAMPSMRLLGYVRVRGRPPAASVEVDGIGTYVAREGGSIRFSIAARPAPATPAANGEPARATAPRQQIPIVLKVIEVAPDGVVVQVGTLGETMVIR